MAVRAAWHDAGASGRLTFRERASERDVTRRRSTAAPSSSRLPSYSRDVRLLSDALMRSVYHVAFFSRVGTALLATSPAPTLID